MAQQTIEQALALCWKGQITRKGDTSMLRYRQIWPICRFNWPFFCQELSWFAVASDYRQQPWSSGILWNHYSMDITAGDIHTEVQQTLPWDYSTENRRLPTQNGVEFTVICSHKNSLWHTFFCVQAFGFVVLGKCRLNCMWTSGWVGIQISFLQSKYLLLHFPFRFADCHAT